MKVVTSLAFALAALLSASAFAADKAPADKLTPQQQKLSDCAKDAHAKSLKGDEYKSYMSTCTKGSGTAAAAAAAPAKTAATAPAKTTDENGRPIGRNGKTKTPATATAAETSADATASKAEPAAAPNPWVATPGNTKAVNAQQQKMKTCAGDAKAKGLKGNDRRTYMSTCLKGDTSAPAAATPTPAPTPAPAKKTGA
jgi:hypothetical protein